VKVLDRRYEEAPSIKLQKIEVSHKCDVTDILVIFYIKLLHKAYENSIYICTLIIQNQLCAIRRANGLSLETFHFDDRFQ
jgi:hypothetical protein